MQYYIDVAYRYRRSSVVCHSVCHSRGPKGVNRYRKGGHAPSIWTSSPDCLPGLCPWTLLEDFRPPDLLLCPLNHGDRLTLMCEPAKVAEPIEMPFGMWTWMVSKKHIVDGGAHWHGLANMTAQSMSGGNVALCELF